MAFVNKNEVHSYQTQARPASLESNTSPQSIRGSVRLVQIAASSGNQGSNGVVLFQIAPSASTITRKTLYWKTRVVVTTGTAPTYASAATALSFNGAGSLVLTADISGGSVNNALIPRLSCGYQVLSRCTAFSGSTVLGQANFVNDEMSLLLAHNASRDWVQSDATISVGMGSNFIPISATQSYIDLCLPLPIGAFQGAQDFPAWALTSPVSIQLDLASYARAIFAGSTVAGTEYQCQNNFLCYEAVDLPSEVVDSLRSSVNSSPFIVSTSEWLNMQAPMSALASYSIGMNASSINGVFVLPLNATGYTAGTQLNYARNFSDASLTGSTWSTNNGTGVGYQVYLDGRLVNSVNVDNYSTQFTQLKQALTNCPATNVQNTSAFTNVSEYINKLFALGVDCTAFNDESTLMGGSPCSNLTLQIQGASQTTFLCTVLINYNTLLAFGPNGVIEVKR